MKTPKTPKLTDAERHKRFLETADKIGASDRSEDFDNAFKKIAPPNFKKAESGNDSGQSL